MDNVQTVNTEVREKIQTLEDAIKTHPEGLIGDCFPLEHFFAKGLYVRKLTVPAGTLTVTKIHKHSHATFLLKGEITVIEESGKRYVEAPAMFITSAWTKRAIFHHTEVIIVTVHATEETDVDKIEEEIIAKNFSELEGKELEVSALEAV